MKQSLKRNIFSIAIFLLGYLGFSYVSLELNLFNWNQDARFVFSLFSIFVFLNNFAMPKNWFN